MEEKYEHLVNISNTMTYFFISNDLMLYFLKQKKHIILKKKFSLDEHIFKLQMLL